MAIDVILGLQWGDEGKGKIVDYLAERYQIVARFQGGPNAGHTLKFDGQKYVLHTIPSGVFRAGIINIIGNGVVIDPVTFSNELYKLDQAGLDYRDRLLVSKRAHLITPSHRMLDAASEASKGKYKIGSTLKGIGPAYMDKTGRNGIRVGDIMLPDFEKRYRDLKAKHAEILNIYPPITFDLANEEEKWFAGIEELKKLQLIDSEYYINDALKDGKEILAEGAQGSMLDIEFGTYPFVTSSNTITAGVCSGLGVPPQRIRDVIGITKAYCTRVGGGPFPTELNDEMGEYLRQEGAEFGATTGRPRRCGWIDLPQLRYTIMLNGVTKLVITKIDVLNNMDTVAVAHAYRYEGLTHQHTPYDLSNADITPIYTEYPGWKKSLEGIDSFEALPDNARDYVSMLERALEVPITMISTGADRKALILR